MSIYRVIASTVSRGSYAASLSAPIDHVRDTISAEERRLIDEAVAAGCVRVIPRGVSSEQDGEPGACLMTRHARAVLASRARKRAEKARGLARLRMAQSARQAS